ncbi:flagellar basal body-associated FliL family protein [Rhodovulum sp. DZ06]|uniref:flagellar basal body-associated FliL family protein n=1 Tax=Rhodovulum sp. DZ06 TaxID=3425126 RepID=UPI003D358D8F
MKKLLPILLAIIGLVGGLAAGHFLKPPPEEHAEAGAEGAAEGGHGAEAAHGADDGHGGGHGDGHDEMAAEDPSDIPKPEDHDPEEAAQFQYVALDKQFVVPLVDKARVKAMIIMSLSIETKGDGVDIIRQREPKLRDVFLQVMFRHAQSGGFDGVFTGGQVMADLRSALRDAGQGVLGEAAHDVLVTDIVRQDM